MRPRWVAVVTCCIAAVPVWGQESPLPDLFSEVIDVRVVNVEVVVTDKKGNRIRGLEADDFELLVDGESVPIAYFTEVDDGYAKSSTEDGVENLPSLARGEPVGTSYLIFIDDLHASQKHRDRALDRLEQDLALLTSADRVAIVAFDGDGLSRLTDWTDSRHEIGQALVLARLRKALGRARSVFGPDQTRKAVVAAAATVRSFYDAPGRKVMLLLVDGWSARDESGDIRAAPPEANIESLYSPLVHSANQVGYTLYPVDLLGFEDMPLHWTGAVIQRNYRYSSPSTGDSRGWSLVGYRPSAGHLVPLVTARRGKLDALRFLARQTGGEPMLRSDRDRALRKTTADTRSYYWLGFEAPRDKDDGLHQIKVRLTKQRGTRIRSRKHYLDMSTGTEVTMLVEGSLFFGGSPGKDALSVRLGSSRKGGFRKILVPMEVSIPLDDLQLLPVAGQWRSELEFRVALIDEHGRRSEIPVSKIPVVGSRKPQAGESFIYETDLLMRKRGHRYVAAVYDPLSGAILSTSGDIGGPAR